MLPCRAREIRRHHCQVASRTADADEMQIFTCGARKSNRATVTFFKGEAAGERDSQKTQSEGQIFLNRFYEEVGERSKVWSRPFHTMGT